MNQIQESFTNSHAKEEPNQKVPVKPMPISKFGQTTEPQKTDAPQKNPDISRKQTPKIITQHSKQQQVFRTQESTNPCTIEVEVIPETPDLPPPQIKWSSDPADYGKITSELYFGNLIGEGSFAKVFEGFDKVNKRPVAIKVIKKKI